jgi:integrase
LIDCFRSDEDSSYQEVQDDTASNYDVWFKMIEETVGKRVLKYVVTKDFRRWFREWKKRSAGKGGDGTRTAYGGIQGIRMLLNYGVESGFKVCKELREGMDMIRFRRGAAREEILSYAEVRSIIEKALAVGKKRLALAQALQFETFLRQKDVIGSWAVVEPGYVAQPGEVVLRGKVWRGLTMESLTLGKDLRIRTSKTGQPVVHRLASCELVVHVLGHFTADEWIGPVACREDGTPFPDRQSYAKLWRSVAEGVGISTKKQNRDSRASGISEAAEAGVSDDAIQRQSGHAGNQILKKVYERLGGDTSQGSHEKRRAHRTKQAGSAAAE